MSKNQASIRGPEIHLGAVSPGQFVAREESISLFPFFLRGPDPGRYFN